jgi:hypothetical protein
MPWSRISVTATNLCCSDLNILPSMFRFTHRCLLCRALWHGAVFLLYLTALSLAKLMLRLSCMNEKMCIEHWWNYTDRGAAKYAEKYLLQRHFVNHKFHVCPAWYWIRAYAVKDRPSNYGLSVFRTHWRHDMYCLFYVNYLQIIYLLSLDTNSVPCISPP